MTTSKRYNPARRQAAGLANLAWSYLRDGIAPTADTESLRLAAEALPLDVEVLIAAIESNYPDDSRAGAMARAGVISRLANALASSAIIGGWHFDAGELQEKARLRLRANVMRNSPRAMARTENNALRLDKLQSDIRGGSWTFQLADSDACAKKIRKAFGYKDGEWPQKSTVRRAIAAVIRSNAK